MADLNPAALVLDGVYQHVGGRRALSGVSLAVDQGQALFLIGPNGAGKSLLTRLILGLDLPSAGQVRVLGQDPGRLRAGAMRRLRKQVGAVLQGGSLIQGRSVIENLMLALKDEPMSLDEVARAARLVLVQLGLDGLENQLPRALSLGQQRRVDLARALIKRPRLLIWDGFRDGLDPPSTREILALLQSLREQHQMTLIATDNAADLDLPDAQRIALIDRGEILFDGDLAGLAAAARERIDVRYLLEGQA